MPRIQYAFRDEEKTIALLTQGSTETNHLCQIITLRKREIASEFMNQFLALDTKGGAYHPVTDYTEIGHEIKLTDDYRHCLVKITLQIEFTVKMRVMQKLAEFMPIYTANALYKFFEGQPYGYIIVLQIFESATEIPDILMKKGRTGSAQVIRFYDQDGQKTSFDLSDSVKPLIDAGTFEYIKDEIIHILNVENVLVGIYGNDESSKKLLDQKRITRNIGTGRHKFIYSEDEDIDRSFINYDYIYKRIVELDPALVDLVEHIKDFKAPQMVEWQMLMPKASSGNKAARTRLVEMYARNVLRLALYFSERYNLPIADVIQDGFVGLLKAVDKFDQAENDSHFQSYLSNWIRQSIQREMPNYMYEIYIPMHVHEKLMSICQIAKRLSIILPPDSEDHKILVSNICSEMCYTKDKAEYLVGLFDSVESIDEIVILDQEFQRGLTTDSMEMVLDSVQAEELQNIVEKCMKGLSLKERTVLAFRFGLQGNESKTLEEVGQVMGVTRERVRQIESKALQKISQSPGLKILKTFW